MRIRQSNWITHMEKYHTIYIFTIILFLTGIIFGAIIVNSMAFPQKQDLFFYLERFFHGYLQEDALTNNNIFKNSFIYHIQTLAVLFFLGFAVIGMPVIWVLLFLKGVAIGFTVGFFVNQLGTQGLLFAFSAIAPQNLILIPLYIGACSIAMIFSLNLIQSIVSKRYKHSIMQTFTRYVATFVILVAIAGVAAFLESIVSFEAMRWVANIM
ncbi:stage II sporulation protein M [Gracilibacillus halotolerans]|uniref:Stage II sporulation protein M n=1 Tax=Gracilibacillus halotolerans TaxID=74386 RepID=A0A841RCP3_9BACI|nr:stage II sporulation protein M [Gracilibacillus halotolerans]MBB6511720.1 stage II sporulation protein M [Gracilibacillus halotolerans]